MKKIVFLGSKNIGRLCLEYLIQNSQILNIEIIGVLTNERGTDIKCLCEENSISQLSSLDEYLELPVVDYVFSIQYHEILKSKHINKARDYTINLHMAPLPDYRGCNQFSFAIANNARIFGTTLHLIDEGVDSGPIIFEKRFEIPPNIWVEDLYKITESHSYKLFCNSIRQILLDDFTAKPQSDFLSERGTNTYKRSDIERLKTIDLNWSNEKIERYIRATYMPGFSPPKLLVDNKIFELNEFTSNG